MCGHLFLYLQPRQQIQFSHYPKKVRQVHIQPYQRIPISEAFLDNQTSYTKYSTINLAEKTKLSQGFEEFGQRGLFKSEW